MNLPFTLDQFLSVFEQYNLAVWPSQVVLNAMAVGALILAVRKTASSDKVISSILAFFWLWIGLVYHLLFFTSINPGAYLFGALNILQGGVFLYYGLLKGRLSFRYQKSAIGAVGSLFLAYGLLIYPLLGVAFGHVYPKSPTFGLPCPTTIFTFGILLWTGAKIPKPVIIIPLLWSFIGFSAALTMGIYEDIGLLVAGVVGSALIFLRDRKS